MADEADIKEKSPAEFWKESGLYDADIFKKDRLHDSDLTEKGALRDDFIRAAKLVYKMQEGKESTLDDDSLIKWGIEFQRDYDMQTAGWGWRGSIFTKRALQRAETTDEQRSAFRYLKDVYELYDDSTSSQVFSAATDLTNLVTIPLSGGTATLAKIGAAKILSGGATNLAAKAVTWMASKPKLTGALVGSVDNVATTIVDNVHRQNASITLGEQHEFNTGKAAASATISVAFGVAVGAASSRLGKWLGNSSTPPTPKIDLDSLEWKKHLPALGRKSAEQWGGSAETTLTQDIIGSIKTAPMIAWNALYDPTKIKLDAQAKLVAKVVKGNYETLVKLGETIPIWNPRLQRRYKELSMIDVNSHRYIYPITDSIDTVIEKHLKPMFSAGQGAVRGGLSDITDSKALMVQLKSIGEQIRNGADPKTFDTQIQNVLNQLPTLRSNIHARIDPMNNDFKPIEKALADIPVPPPPMASNLPPNQPPQNSLKKSRVDTLQEYVGIIRDQGTRMVDGIDDAVAKIKSINGISSRNATFGDSLIKIADELDGKINTSVVKSEELLAGAHLRMTGEDLRGYVGKVENIRKLKRSIDEQYINPHVRTLKLFPAKDKLDNNENYFLFIVDHWKSAWDPEKKKFKLLSERQPSYTTNLAAHIARLYASGDEQDAIHAIRLLRYHQGLESEQIIPDDIGEFVLKKLQSDYFGPQGLDVNKDAHTQHWLRKLSDATLRDHAPDVGGPRDVQKWYVEQAKNWIGGRMYPQNQVDQYVAAPFRSYAFSRPIFGAKQEMWAYLTGRKVVPLSDVPGRVASTGAEKELKTTIVSSRFHGLWWDETPKDGNRFMNFITGAPSVLKAPVRIITSPLALGWWGTKNLFDYETKFLDWKIIKRFTIASGIVGAGALAGNLYGENFHPDDPFYINTATRNVSHAGIQAARLGIDTVTLPLRGSIWVAKEATKPFTGFDNYLGLRPEYFSTSFYENLLFAQEPKKDESKPEGSAQMDSSQKPEAQKPGGATSDSKKPEDEKKREKLRKELLIFGKRTADLTNEIATAGAWTDDSRKEVDKLLAQEAKLKEDINRLGLGTYALDIHQHAKNTLTYQLEPNMKTGNIPHEVSSFEQVDETRQKGEGKNVALWYNNILRLNHEVDERGWDKAGERKKRAVELNNAKAELAKNLLFLDTSVQKQYKDAEGWIGALVAASGAPADSEYAKIRRADAELLDIPDQPQDESKISGRKIQPPETKRDTQSNTGSSGDVSSPSAGNGSSPGLGGAAVTPPVSTPPASTPGPGGNTSGGQTVRVPKEEKSVGDYIDDGVDALSKGKDAFVQATGISADDPVGRMADSGINMLGAGVGAGFGMLKNTFNYLKNKKDGSGRGLLREGGALAASFLGMALLVGPAMDKMGLGNSFFKLAAFVAVYMIARKGIHTMMEETPGVMQTSGNNGQTHAALDTGGNSTVLSADKGGTHLPLARREQDAASRLMAMNNIETIPHDKPGADATVTKISNDLIRLMTQAPTPEMSPG